jgi:hypothetical protein
MRRRVPGTAGLTGADRWDNITEQILPRRTAQLRAVLPTSSTTVASVIRSRSDPTAGHPPEPSSAPHPGASGNTAILIVDEGGPASETSNDRTERSGRPRQIRKPTRDLQIFGVSYPSRAASYMTLRIPLRSRAVEKYPPFWRRFMFPGVPGCGSRIWMICASSARVGRLNGRSVMLG